MNARIPCVLCGQSLTDSGEPVLACEAALRSLGIVSGYHAHRSCLADARAEAADRSAS